MLKQWVTLMMGKRICLVLVFFVSEWRYIRVAVMMKERTKNTIRNNLKVTKRKWFSLWYFFFGSKTRKRPLSRSNVFKHHILKPYPAYNLQNGWRKKTKYSWKSVLRQKQKQKQKPTCFSYFWASFSSLRDYFFKSKSRECPCHLDEVIRVERLRNLLSSGRASVSVARSHAYPSLHLSLGTCRWRRLLIHPSLCAHPLNTDPPRNPDQSCGSWNRQESGHCGNYWALIRGARMTLAGLKTSHHSGILETVWPLSALTVTWSSYSPVECVCNTLSNWSVWYCDCEPIYRHDLSTRACSWIRSPRLRPAGTGLQRQRSKCFWI